MSNHDGTSIEELSPSAKLLIKVLEYDGSQTQKQLIEESMLSPRTVRYALDDLTEAGLVTESVYLADARQSLYELADGASREHGTVADGGDTTDAELSHSDSTTTGNDACCGD